MDNPFHPPQEIATESSLTPRRKQRGISYVIASILWATMAVKLAVLGPVLRTVFADFDVQLPLLTRVLLHPMATVFFFVIAVAVIASGVVANTAAERQKPGQIALVMGVIAVAICFVGLALPMLEMVGRL